MKEIFWFLTVMMFGSVMTLLYIKYILHYRQAYAIDRTAIERLWKIASMIQLIVTLVFIFVR